MPLTAQRQSRSPDSGISLVIRNASAGNHAAFNQLVSHYHDSIFRMVYYRTRSRLDAEDLTQEVFIRAFKGLSRLKKLGQFRSWLYSIALNLIRDFYRKKKLKELLGLRQSGENIENSQTKSECNHNPEALDNILRKNFWKEMGVILDNLPRMEREVFLLKFFDHLSINEVSRTLKKSESTVKTHLYRALHKLRSEPFLKQLWEDDTL